jgi:hypothetical protein
LSCFSKRSSRTLRSRPSWEPPPSVDGSDCHTDLALLTTQIQIFLVAVEFGGPAAFELVHLSRALGLARSTLWDPSTREATTSAGGFSLSIIRTAPQGSHPEK